MIPFQSAVQSINPVAAAAFATIAVSRRRQSAGFAAHRNDIAVELMRTLADGFPTIVRMLGEDAFLDVAAQFVAQQAPTVPASMFYGDRFPAFLRETGTTASAAYVADVAAIDSARITARQLAAAIPHLNSERPADDRSAQLTLHPSTILLRSKFPAVTGWQVNQPRGDRWVRHWGAEDALVACTRLEPEVWRLPDGGFAFLTALQAGASLTDATVAGLQASTDFDLEEAIAVLTASNIVTRVRPANRNRHRNNSRRPDAQTLQLQAIAG